MKWVKRILVLLILLAVVGYFGVPALVGTGWAKNKVKAAMEEETGREVEIGSISFGWGSGLTVDQVTMKQKPGDMAEEGPLFKLENMKFRIGLGDVLKKKINVEEFTVDGPEIVIVRDKDGRFNFSDILDKAAAGETEEPSAEEKKGPPADVKARLDIENGRLVYVDVPLGTRVVADALDAKALWDNGNLDFDMGFKLNNGEVKLNLGSNVTADPMPLRVSEFSITGAELTKDLASLAYFLPLLGKSPQQVGGKLTFVMKDLKADGFDPDSLKKTLSATGRIEVEGGALVTGVVSQIFTALQAIGANDLSAIGGEGADRALRFDVIKSDFSIGGGKVTTENLSFVGDNLDLKLSGSTTLDGKLDYKMAIGQLGELLQKNEQIRKYLGEDGTIPFTLSGSMGSPKVGVDAESALKSAAEKEIEDRTGIKLPGGIKELLPGGK